MKDQLPAPDFDAGQYERPNHEWVCGRAAEGRCCRVGPSAHGHCRASHECRPILELKEGETKGRFRCTRTAEFGGPCESGPLPDGTCCHAIMKCQPVRSLRSKRKMFTRAVVVFTVGFLLIAFARPFRPQFINPGKLSAQHAPMDCGKCHAAAQGSPATWPAAALLRADPPVWDFGKLLERTNFGSTAIDGNCKQCHDSIAPNQPNFAHDHSFHQPNVVRDPSCSACHREHLGGGPIRPPEDVNCVACHANAAIMAASAEKAHGIPAAKFDYRWESGHTLFKAPRPEIGYTRIIHAFDEDHPEFQVIRDRDKMRDPDTLKFNHQLHLSSPNIPALKDGKRLECASCHKPDATGMYFARFSYEQNCKECHSLQFDEKNPNLRVPHGNPEFARAFLRSLPEIYGDEYEQTEKGPRSPEGRIEFINRRMLGLGDKVTSIDQLEKQIFTSGPRTGAMEKISGQEKPAPSRYPGCAYCHEVKLGEGDALPMVTRPVLIDRWLIRGRFDHSKHMNMDCTACHDQVRQSRDTKDILLPSRATCVKCHGRPANGGTGVSSQCSTCHTYHATPKAALTLTSAQK